MSKTRVSPPASRSIPPTGDCSENHTKLRPTAKPRAGPDSRVPTASVRAAPAERRPCVRTGSPGSRAEPSLPVGAGLAGAAGEGQADARSQKPPPHRPLGRSSCGEAPYEPWTSVFLGCGERLYGLMHLGCVVVFSQNRNKCGGDSPHYRWDLVLIAAVLGGQLAYTLSSSFSFLRASYVRCRLRTSPVCNAGRTGVGERRGPDTRVGSEKTG